MVMRFLLLTCLFAVNGCGETANDPIGLKPHGQAVRANLAAHIVNPIPPPRRVPLSDAERAVAGVERYRTGEVKDPTAQSTSPQTTTIE